MCSADEYSVISGSDTVSCRPCPVGGDCSGRLVSNVTDVRDGAGSHVVLLEDVIAMPG